MSLVLRRGRCNKIFAKYVSTCIFEDPEASSDQDATADTSKKLLSKRKKKYVNVLDYLKQEIKGFDDMSLFSLLRD